MAALLSGVICGIAIAQEPAATAPGTPDQAAVPIELYQAPKSKKLVTPEYPSREQYRGSEGWVNLSFMVDPKGKPFEISVSDSTGNRTFEKLALDALAHSTFEPGTLNGQAIESAYEMRYHFVNPNFAPGANTDFIQAYRKFLAALKREDRSAADEEMAHLQVLTLYEDAFYGMAQYQYAKLWGTEVQQLHGLRRALSRGDGGPYLPRAMFRAALTLTLRLEIDLHFYAEALGHWRDLQGIGVDAETTAKLQPIIAKIERSRTDDSNLEVTGTIDDHAWYLRLLKRHFQVVVDEGVISEVKLRCARRYVYFAYDPQLRYEVSRTAGSCQLALEGSPGTRFRLEQF